MPPIFSLGYHYSKWESKLTAGTLNQWNYDFSSMKIPVDSFWLDITYTNNNDYFQFKDTGFSSDIFNIVKRNIRDSKRHLVVITDPHLSISPPSKAY